MYALRRLLIRNSIEPSHTGNCTHFDDALCEPNGLFHFPSKWNQHQETTIHFNDNEENYSCERMLIQLDQESPNELQDNVLYYISGSLDRALISKLKCKECIGELLTHPRDPHALKVADYPIHAKFTCFKQKGGLILPFPAVLKIDKAAKVLFKKRVQWQRWGITYERNIDLKIQYAVLKQFGPGIFHESSAHFFQHAIGVESNHLTSLLKLVTQKYLSLRFKTYEKKHGEMVIHRNMPSLQHELTRTILFRNQ